MSGNISTQKQQKQQKQYQDYVKKITPVHSLGLNMCKAFFTGGIICVLGQFILNYAKSLGLDKDTSGSWCSLILILISVILTGLNLYSKIGKFGAAKTTKFRFIKKPIFNTTAYRCVVVSL